MLARNIGGESNFPRYFFCQDMINNECKYLGQTCKCVFHWQKKNPFHSELNTFFKIPIPWIVFRNHYSPYILNNQKGNIQQTYIHSKYVKKKIFPRFTLTISFGLEEIYWILLITKNSDRFYWSGQFFVDNILRKLALYSLLRYAW